MKISLFSSAILALSSLPSSQAGTLQFDLERREVPKFTKLRRRGNVQAPVYNSQGDLLYLVNITAGNPPQSLQLQLDTGSSDVWLPYSGSQPCASITSNRCGEGSYDPSQSNSSKLISSGAFQISYVDGTKITGDYIADDFSIGGTTVKSMTMGLARSAVEQESSSDFTGIVGVGFEQGEAIYASSGNTYPNLLSMLKSTGVINAKAFSLWLNDKGERLLNYTRLYANQNRKWCWKHSLWWCRHHQILRRSRFSANSTRFSKQLHNIIYSGSRRLERNGCNKGYCLCPK